MDQERVKKTKEEIEQEAVSDIKNVSFTGDLVADVRATLLRSVQKATKDETKQMALQKFHQALSKFTAQNVQSELLTKLPIDQQPVLFDYVNYSFECLSKGVKLPQPCASYNASFLLALYNKLIELRGLPIILESISQKKTLPTQIITIK